MAVPLQSGLYGLSTEEIPIELKDAEKYIRSFDWDEFTPHRYSGGPPLAIWEIVALHHWLDPSRMNLQDGDSAKLVRLHELAAAWKSKENRAPAFLDTLVRVQYMIDLYSSIELESRPGNQRWTWKMFTFIFEEQILRDLELPNAPEPLVLEGGVPKRAGAANVAVPCPAVWVDISTLPVLVRLAVNVAIEVSLPVALGGTYQPGDRHSVPDRGECINRHALALGITAGQLSTASKNAMRKMVWPSDAGSPSGRPLDSKARELG